MPYVDEHDNCSGQWQSWHEAVFNGQLTDTIGLIIATETRTPKNFSNCPDINPGYSVTYDHPIDIEILGDTITGSTRAMPDDEDGYFMYTITATRQ